MEFTIPDNKKKIIHKLLEYSFSIVLHANITMFKLSDSLKIDRNDFKKVHIAGLINTLMYNYLGEVYNALVKKNDMYIVDKFLEMKSYINFSEYCLLNYILCISTALNNNTSKEKLNVSTIDNYFKSLEEQLEIAKKKLEEFLKGNLNHKCNEMSYCTPFEQEDKVVTEILFGNHNTDIKLFDFSNL